jgi:hypothetical protein
MNTEDFWTLIDKSREAADGDPEEQLEHLETLLSELEPDEIVAFDKHFAEFHNQAYTWGLWGAAYLIGGGCSDDGFMDFRGWLVSRGQDVYEKALSNPDSLARLVSEDDECQVEGFQYLPKQVWSEVAGEEESDFPKHDIEYRAEPVGKEWEEDKLDGLFPKLAKKFG